MQDRKEQGEPKEMPPAVAPLRFVSFMDILGFADLVESTALGDVIQKITFTLQMQSLVQSLNCLPSDAAGSGIRFDPTGRFPKLTIFSFSDTFVLASHDDSVVSFFQVIVGTALFSKYLFAAGLPVRGAITCGEAAYIPGTSHLVGRAITRAARLEKDQEWFGVLLDPEILTPERRQVLALPFVRPLVVDYEVPLKPDAQISSQCTVINWRFNLNVQSGVDSLLPQPSLASGKSKRENTLSFCRWLREHQLAYGEIRGASGAKLDVPWLGAVMVGPHQPGTPGATHGDQY